MKIKIISIILMASSTILLILVIVVTTVENHRLVREKNVFAKALNVISICNNKSDVVQLLGNPSDLKKNSQLKEVAQEASWFSLFDSAARRNTEDDLDILVYFDADYVYCYAINRNEEVVGLSLWCN